MAKCRAWVMLEPQKMVMQEFEIPQVAEESALLKVEACGICGTDVSMFKGDIAYGSHVPGKIFGHEVTGTVEEIGSEVSRICKNDRVIIAPVNYCGKCFFCLRGEENLCQNWTCIGEEIDGGYAQYLRVPEKQVFPLPSQIGFDEGTLLADPLPTPLHAIRSKSNIKPGDVVALWGSGAQGFCALQIAKLAGATAFNNMTSSDESSRWILNFLDPLWLTMYAVVESTLAPPKVL